MRAGDVMFMWEPLYHIGGAQMIVLPLIRDVTLALVEQFSASRFWRQVRDERRDATSTSSAASCRFCSSSRPPTSTAAHGARIAWGGGCPREIWRPFEERFGVQIRECYGMTECSSITTYNDNGTLGAVGKPAPWFEVELIDAVGRAGCDRRARRDRGAHVAPRRDHARLSVEPGGDRARACAAMPSTPATSARSMPTATCISTAA